MYKTINFHFRHNRRNRHPAIIVGETDEGYLFLKMTHSSTTRNCRIHNIPLNKNPNPKDNRISYIEHRIIKDNKQCFYNEIRDWQLSEKDISKVRKIIEQYKK